MDNSKNSLQNIIKNVQTQNYTEAEQLCILELKSNPNNQPILTLLGTIYYNNHEFIKSIEYFEKALKLKYSENIIKLLGNAYYYIGNYEKAYPFLKDTLNFKREINTLKKLTHIAVVTRVNMNDAYKFGLEIEEKSPFDLENLSYLGELCLNLGQFEKSLYYANKILAINPKFAKGLILKGIIEEVIFSDDKTAQKYFKKAIRYGEIAEGYYNLSINYSHSDRKKSNQYAKYLIKNNLSNRTNELNNIIGSNYFALKQLKRGIAYFEKSWDDIEKPFKNFWDMQPHQDKTCYLHLTKGFGDQIMFIRYLPLLAKNFKSIKIPCSQNVLQLFKHSFSELNNVEFFEYKDLFTDYDYSTSIFFLPYHLKMDFNDIPYSSGYLKCDTQKINEYKTKYFDINKTKIGICWEAGGAILRTDLKRSIPLCEFKDLIEILTKNGNRIYSVQKNADEINSKSFRDLNITDIGSHCKTFYDTASALKNLDYLITVDTSVAHLAGALGIKTILILPYFSDWRWFDSSNHTDWYKSVTIIRLSAQINKRNELLNIQNLID